MRFKANARRNKLLGAWAAQKLGLAGPDADAYAKEVVMADFEEAGDDDVFRKVRKDFDAKGVKQSDQDIRSTMTDADGAGDCPDQGGLNGARSLPRPRKAGRRRAPFSAEIAASWYEGKEFATDWTSWHFPNWTKLLNSRRNRALRVLEIGSWEGRSALFFLNYLPRASAHLHRHVCGRPGASGSGGAQSAPTRGFSAASKAASTATQRPSGNASKRSRRPRPPRSRSSASRTAASTSPMSTAATARWRPMRTAR